MVSAFYNVRGHPQKDSKYLSSEEQTNEKVQCLYKETENMPFHKVTAGQKLWSMEAERKIPRAADRMLALKEQLCGYGNTSQDQKRLIIATRVPYSATLTAVECDVIDTLPWVLEACW